MKGFVTKARDQQFFHDKEYVDKYFGSQSKIKRASIEATLCPIAIKMILN
jgi:hypothetical protein